MTTTTLISQSDKATRFRALHTRGSAFIIPNPWDAGSARMLALQGFDALASSSAGLAFSMAAPDNAISRDALLIHLQAIVVASGLPVSADLGDCFGGSAETAAQTILLAAATGIVGGSIEDGTNLPNAPIYSMDEATERVRAASEAARSLGFAFTLTARAENFLNGRPDLGDTIKRLQSYQEAGADVLFAPGLPDIESVKTVLASIDRPLNVLVGSSANGMSLEALSAAGVARISVGSGLFRAAYSALIRAATELKSTGTFEFAKGSVSFGEFNAMFVS